MNAFRNSDGTWVSLDDPTISLAFTDENLTTPPGDGEQCAENNMIASSPDKIGTFYCHTKSVMTAVCGIQLSNTELQLCQGGKDLS